MVLNLFQHDSNYEKSTGRIFVDANCQGKNVLGQLVKQIFCLVFLPRKILNFWNFAWHFFIKILLGTFYKISYTFSVILSKFA